ncbi:MAG: preprotein translocase subunit YajC [Alphaproteobacteria bacterium]|jgi:preprotein translocase subunit YajC|nr:preprotein translocase subunit YajC [Alphaproteobacteria bacterium]MBP9777164.1 preprotein translocase subunit YajC [Alphaproteobacteria bacterium]
MDLFITPALAQSATIAGFDFMSLLPLVLIFAVFYFFLIRPQQKKAQQQKELLAGLRRGDKVVTNGGLIGVISKVISDQEVQVEIAEGVRVRVVRAMISQILSKTEPVSEDTSESSSSEDKKSIKKTAVKGPTVRKKKSS